MKIFKVPFAATGDKIAIPTVEQPSGEVSQPTGWTPDYQLPNTDPNYKPVGRDEMNGVLFEITEALGQLQQFGFADWQNITGGWPVGANVNHGGGVWQSLANANTEEPGSGSLWKPILFENVSQATETELGLLRIATTAESLALTNDLKALTPKKLGDAMNSHVLGMEQGWQTPSRSLATTYTNTTGRPIQVYVATYLTSENSGFNMQANVGGTTFDARGGGNPSAGAYKGVTMGFVVPSGATYRVTTTNNAAIESWKELR